MKYGTWTVSSYDPAAAEALGQAGFSPITAAVLCSRGYDTPALAKAFLSPQCPLSDPFDLLDMDKAAARVRRAIDAQEHIAVFGDYDVDGITATCLLTEFLRKQGATVTSYIPARMEEGYGLNELAIRSLHEKGVQLIVTVDCGITAEDEAALCRALGIELVITDHHECKASLPDAVAVVDPHRKDQPLPHLELAGVGVAFKLAAAISGEQDALLLEYCDLLCLGTVADVMPLTGENRAMVACGLRALAQPHRVGVKALLHECATSKQPVNAGTIGYTLAPRINAAGRMGVVNVATELFLTKDANRASVLAAQLCRLNRKRQDIEADIYTEAVAMLPPDRDPAAIVLASESWHQGVVGIVASRLAEEFSCPAILICLDGDKGKASSRSYGGFNLFQSLESMSELLESYGGHELAAGFTIRKDRIDAFRDQLTALSADFTSSGACDRSLKLDCEIPGALLTLDNIAALEELEPCGASCPRPMLIMRNLTVTDLTEVCGGKHLRLRLSDGKQSYGAIFFSTDAKRAGVAQGDLVEIAYTPQINEFRGVRSVQLNLADIRPDEASREARRISEGYYHQFTAGTPLSQTAIDTLLPERRDFVAVWKYLRSAAVRGVVCEEFGCLCRKIARFADVPCSYGRTRVCLDVFCEQRLLQLEQRPGHLRIKLLACAHKADLDKSAILNTLKNQKAGI